MFAVYEVTGPTGVYYGKTKDPANRFRRHHKEHAHFSRAVRKYGREAFSYRTFQVFDTEAQAYVVERALVAAARLAGTRLYNVADGGLGGRGSPEAQKKATEAARIANTGRKHGPERLAAQGAGIKKYWAGLDPVTRERRNTELRKRARAAALIRWNKKRTCP